MGHLLAAESYRRQPISFGTRINPRYMVHPEMSWVGARAIGDPNGNFARGSSLTDVADGQAGLGIKFTGGTSNAYTRTGGITTTQTKATFVSVFSWLSGAANSFPQLGGFASTNASFRLGASGSAGGDIGMVKGGVVSLGNVSVTSGVIYIMVTSHRQDTGDYYIITKPLGGGAIARTTSTNTNASTASNGTYAVGVSLGGAFAWNGNIYMLAGAFEWMPESLAMELLDNPYQLFLSRQDRPDFGVTATASFKSSWANASNTIIPVSAT